MKKGKYTIWLVVAGIIVCVALILISVFRAASVKEADRELGIQPAEIEQESVE